MIVKYLSKLYLGENEDKDSEKFPWIVHDRFVFSVNGIEMYVPDGFKTDLASIPKFLWWFQKPFGKEINKAAVPHDFMYSAEILPRGIMDDIFYAGLLECGMPQWKSKVCWTGVRAGGGFTYGEHTPSRIALIRSMGGIAEKTIRPIWSRVEDVRQAA